MKFTLGNVRIFAGGLDLTGQSNKIELSGEFDEKDVTDWSSVDEDGQIWKQVQAGIGSASLTASGQWSAGDMSQVDDALWATQGTAMPWSVFPRMQGASSATPPAPGDLAWLVKASQSKYQIGDQVGNIAPWSASASGTSPLVRGKILHPPGVARAAGGSGAAVQLGAVDVGRALVAGVHLLSTADAAAALTVTIESAADADFTAPTTRLTFQPAQTVIGQALLLAGPVADTYWRASWTIAAGAAPSFLFVVTAGIA